MNEIYNILARSKHIHMPGFLLDCEMMRYTNTGMFEFCKQLGHALLTNKQPNETLSFYVPDNLKGFFGPNEKYIANKGYHRFWMPGYKGIDVWHTTYQKSKHRPSDRHTKQVLTIHDLNYIHEQMPAKKIKHHLNVIQRNIDNADHITTISQFVMDDVQKYLRINKPASVVYNGLAPDIYPDHNSPAYRPERPFLFAIGSINAKKNFHVLPYLLKGNDYELVIAGPVFDAAYQAKLMQEAQQHGVTDRVKVLGSISGPDKYWYLNNCLAFAFPSLAEGFGLPVVEAMQAGKPCFISDKTSLPEIGGQYCYYFHNFDPVHMQQVFQEGLHDYQVNNRAAAIAAHGHTFSQSKTAQGYLDIYRSLH